jgi:hypothetical protein
MVHAGREKNQEGLFFAIHDQVSKIQQEMEEKFKIMGKELNFMEERIDSVHENLMETSYKPRRSSEKSQVLSFSPENSKSNKSTQTPYHLNKKISSKNTPIAFGTRQNSAEGRVDHLTNAWGRTLSLLEQGEMSEAYENVLQMKDDIYLLRLMCQTQPCLNMLNPETAGKVMKKLCGIMQSRFVENISLDWVEQAGSKGLLSGRKDQNFGPLFQGLERFECTSAIGHKRVNTIYNIISNGIYN